MRIRTFAFAALFTIAPVLGAAERLAPKWELTPTAWKSGPYAYDGAGNVIAAGNDRYRYDGARRLVSATAHTPSFLNTETFQYDLYGNLLRTEKASIPAAGDDVIRTITVMAIAPGSNQLTPTATTAVCPPGVNCMTGAYDGAGNQISSNGIVTYRWDALGNMSELEAGTRVERYVYDADGERVATIRVTGANSQSRSYTLRDIDAKVLRELTDDVASGAHTWKWAKDYIYRDGTLLASIAKSGTSEITRHYHLDHLGTPRLVTDARGYRLSTHTYWPFGIEAPGSEGDLAERMKFTGHERDYGRDRGEDLDYMHARFYTPVGGRFVSVDPVLGGPRNPQSWNRYAYVTNGPLTLIDPLGLKGQQKKPGGGSTSTCRDKPDGSAECDVNATDPERERQERIRRAAEVEKNLKILALYGIRVTRSELEKRARRGDEFAQMALGQKVQGIEEDYAFEYAVLAPFIGFIQNVALSETATVVRWGRAGLQPGDWVMAGPRTPWNYLRSFKWQPGMGNRYAGFGGGETFRVPASSLRWPSGWGVDGWFKGLFGQRIYVP